MLSEEPIEGLLLVGAYREDDVDTAHPARRGRCPAGATRPACSSCGWTTCRRRALADLVAEMLHVDPAAAHDLAGVIGPHTSGNPYETVELLDALRRGGPADRDRRRLAVGRRGGARPPGRDRRGQASSQARVSALPAAARQVVEAMACLGGRTEA